MQKAAPSDESLVRGIGTLALAAAIVNITIGGGIFRLPGNIASSLGAAAPIAYLVCAAAMALIVYCIADAGSRVPLTGGPYAYVGAAFGPYAGFISGVLLWMIGTFATAAVGHLVRRERRPARPRAQRLRSRERARRRGPRLLVRGEHAWRNGWVTAELRRHSREAAAATRHRHRRSLLHPNRELAVDDDAGSGGCSPNMPAADFCVCGD